MEPHTLLPEHGQASVILQEETNQEHYSQGRLSFQPDHAAGEGNSSSRWQTQMDLASLSTAAPRVWQRNLSIFRKSFIRQILGLNPFRTSYFALYRPLNDFPSKLVLIAAVLLAIAGGVPLPIIGLIFGKIINDFPPSDDALQVRLTQLLGVAVAYFIISWGWSVLWGVIGERISRKIREDLVERTLGMEMAFFDVENPNLTNVLTEKTQTIQLGVSEKVGLFIQSVSYFVAAFTVGFILNARLTGILFAAVIPAMGLVVCLGTSAVSKFSKQAAIYTENASSIAESAISGVQVVQAFGILELLAENHLKSLKSALRAGIKKSIVGAAMLGSVFFVAYAANALAFWEGNRQRQDTSAQAGTIYAVVFLILDASFVVGQFGPFIQTFALAAAAGESVFKILDHPEPYIDVYSHEGKPVQDLDFKQKLCFQNVTFVYPARPTVRVLDEVNLHFEAGKVTGIVGASGSGKSTIAALLLRLYDPSSGLVLLGGKDIRHFNVASLRSRIALVNQHPTLFEGTILDNIKQGLIHDEMTEANRLRLCTQAAMDAHCDFIDSLPDGIHTDVGGGNQLSGGQKQRVSLARALVGNPSLLILDEYTSAMDATSEAVVLEALKRSSASSGRTTIIVAHRLATVKDADNIMVMRDGTLLETGQHDMLLEKGGAYAELIKAQMFESNGQSSQEGVSSHPSMKSSNLSASDALYIVEAPKKCSQHGESLVPPSGSSNEKKPRRSSAELIKRCLLLSWPETPFIGLGLFASVLSGSIIIGEALIFGNLVELLNEKKKSEELDSKVQFFCLMFFVLSLIALFAHACSGSAFGLVSENLVLRIRDVSLRTILIQDISWFSKPGHSRHELMSKLSMDTGRLSGLSGVILGTIFSVVTSLIGGIILAHIMAWKISVVLLSAVPIMLAAGFLRLHIMTRAEERHQTAYNGAAALASEACAAISTVAALGTERHVLQRYKAAIRVPYEQSLKFAVWRNIPFAFSLSVTYFVYALAYWWGSKQVRNGSYGEREFFIALPALLFSAQSAGQMFSLAPEITGAKTAARSVFDLHDQQPSIMTDSPKTSLGSRGREKDLTDNTKGCLNESNKGNVVFQNVHLAYSNRPEAQALRNVSLSIQAGQYVAFVGRSGAGKSSSMHLIERFFDPTIGTVFLDGKDIRSEPVQELRARLALVEQEPDLFPGSVKFNIGLGARPGCRVSVEEVENVCKKCGLHEFVMSLPEGYNTECGNNGSRLSGGQRQRLAIARALIRDPEILLLDEATSQLDSHTEREVRAAIAAASSGRTTIMIAHRLASVQHADKIFVFDSGTIVEEGTHDHLVSLGRIYAGMVTAQELR